MKENLGRIGKQYPAGQQPNDDGHTDIRGNRGPVLVAIQKIVDKTPNWFFLLVAVLALIFAILAEMHARHMRSEVEAIRSLLDTAVNRAIESASNAAVAKNDAAHAATSAAINREYAVQVFPQLNRLGYPVKTPGEPGHYVAQPEDYANLDAYAEQRREEMEAK